ncbi:MAG: helix-turn-helix domain-containing protein [Candidatus Bathyarchaeota archaeon]|nr:helix-turn-helix domain-containing protein [Candidatus Bathyarchaeota archaeon]
MVEWEQALHDISPTTSQFKVLVYLSFKGATQPTDISEQTGIPAGTVRPALRTLLEKGYVKQNDDSSYYSLIPFTEIVSHLYSVVKK